MEKISSWAQDIIDQYGNRSKIIQMSGGLYRKLCDRAEPSEMLVTARIQKPGLDDLALKEKPFILILDRPSDAGNLGSIIRSANAFGVDAVLCIGHGVDPWDPKTIRASLGNIFFKIPIQLESMHELENYVEQLKIHHNIKIWGTDSKGSKSLNSVSLERPLMLILGNEAKGISLSFKVLCDGIISIPLSGEVNSLNIASAASIFMWDVQKNYLSGS